MKVDILVIGAHPDDAELAAGGLLLQSHKRGLATGLVCLTDGGAGASGDARTRAEEARAGAAVLEVDLFRPLGMPDTAIWSDESHLAALEETIVELAPRLIVTHSPFDWHPDHRATWDLVENAWAMAARASRHRNDFLARPKLLQFTVDIRRAPKPSLIVDITPSWEKKRSALDCHASQRSVLAEIEMLNRGFGAMVGVTYGEAFTLPEPLAITPELNIL